MGTPPKIDRRRFVALSGTAVVAALAGCTDGDGGGGTTQNGTTAGSPTTAPMETTTAGETETTSESETTTAGQQGFVRVVHASPDAPAVDVYVDDQLAFEGVSYGNVTPYVQLPPREYDVRVTAAEDESTVVFDETVPVEAGYQTALAAGELGGDGGETAFSVSVLSDYSESVGDDEALVRLFHGSPDAPAVDVTVAESGDVLFDGVAFGETTDYASVPPGSYTLEVRPDTEDGSGDVVASFDVTVEAGTAYSAFAVGYVDPSGDQPAFELVATADGETAETTSN